MTEGINYLHSRVQFSDSELSNIAHRDLKPQNVLIGEKNHGHADWVVVLADFGWSKEITEPKDYLTESTTGNHGTFGWRPPQFIDKALTSKSDIFTLGIVSWQLYHVISGKGFQRSGSSRNFKFSLKLLSLVNKN